MSQYPWTSAEAMPPTIGGDEEMAIGDKGEDLPPEEMYLLQDMEAPPDASIVERKDTMHTTAHRRNSYLTMKENGPTSLTWRKKGNKTTKCKMPKNQTSSNSSCSTGTHAPQRPDVLGKRNGSLTGFSLGLIKLALVRQINSNDVYLSARKSMTL